VSGLTAVDAFDKLVSALAAEGGGVIPAAEACESTSEVRASGSRSDWKWTGVNLASGEFGMEDDDAKGMDSCVLSALLLSKSLN